MNSRILAISILIILAGIAYSQCETQIDQVNDSISHYTNFGQPYVSEVYFSYVRLAKCYEDLNEHQKAKEACENCKEWVLKDIEWEKERGHDSFSDAYYALADCYRAINDTGQACKYCQESNKYIKGKVMRECKFYGCPKDSKPANSNEKLGTTNNLVEGNGSMILILGLLVVLLVLGALFMLKRK